MNGDETGVDCGGSCQLLCRTESLPLLLQGDPRVLSLATSTFQVVALVKNSNSSAEIYRARYVLKIYDTQSLVPVKVISGNTHVPRGGDFAIFEGPFNLEPGVVPARATLEWEENSLIWKNVSEALPELKVRNLVFSKASTTPRLDAMIENPNLDSISNVDLTALIYDAQGNIFAASKTFIENLPAGGTAPAVFTWPKPFGREVIRTEILIRIFPDRSFIR